VGEKKKGKEKEVKSVPPPQKKKRKERGSKKDVVAGSQMDEEKKGWPISRLFSEDTMIKEEGKGERDQWRAPWPRLVSF